MPRGGDACRRGIWHLPVLDLSAFDAELIPQDAISRELY